MSLVTFHVLDVVEILLRIPDLIGIAQKRSHEPLVHRLERDDVLAVGQDHASNRDLVHLTDGLADDGESVVTDLTVRTQVVRSDQITRIDLGAVDEFVDLDGPGRFQRDVLEFLLCHLDERVGVNLLALDDILFGDLLAGVGIDLGVLDAVARLPVELVEGYLLGFRVAGYSATGQVTSERRKKLSSSRGGPWTRYSRRGTVRTQDEQGPLVPTFEIASTGSFPDFI
jgi:hypothetical protein